MQEAAVETTALGSSALRKHKEQFLSVRLSSLSEGNGRHVLIESEVLTHGCGVSVGGNQQCTNVVSGIVNTFHKILDDVPFTAHRKKKKVKFATF